MLHIFYIEFLWHDLWNIFYEKKAMHMEIVAHFLTEKESTENNVTIFVKPYVRFALN